MDADSDSPRRTGRRRGNPDTRGQVLAAAEEVFAEQGFDGATIRGIARRAGVDPALIHRWFGDKRGVFMATVQLGFDPLRLIEHLMEGGPEHLGVRSVLAATSVWESRMGRAWVEVVRKNPALLWAMVGYLNTPLVAAARRLLAMDHEEARLRVGLAEGIMLGLATTRYLTRLEPIASLPRDEIARLYGPLVQQAIGGSRPARESDRRHTDRKVITPTSAAPAHA